MPELPEVEVAARSLAAWAAGRRVAAIAVSDRRVLAGGAEKALSVLRGLKLARVDRIGKNILLDFARGGGAQGATRSRSGGRWGVWSHLGMTGKWVRRRALDEAPRFSRLRLDFTGALSLHFVDMRLFGFFRLVPDADFAQVPALAALGPDPLREGIDRRRLVARLGRSRQPVKVAIMDQALIPGVGNIQASEGLHRAGIDPRRLASSLSAAEVGRLSRGILASFRYTLRTFAAQGVLPAEISAKKKHGTTPTRPATTRDLMDVEYVEEPGTANPFRVYARAGARCPRCRGGEIARIVQGGRSTFFCPVCQT